MNYTIEDEQSIPLIPVTESTINVFLESQTQSIINWIQNTNFNASPHDYCVVPDGKGNIQMVLFGLHENSDSPDAAYIWSISNLAKSIPVETYHLETNWSNEEIVLAQIGWGLGAYQYNFFKQETQGQKSTAILKIKEKNIKEINAFVDAFTLVRDLVNTPANHMMPEDLSAFSQEISEESGATFTEIIGDALLEENFPAIHAVGRASVHAPRLLQINWNMESNYPLVVLVGKGVCFDTGGLDLKPSKFMRHMKKDMGGAAHVLGLAHLIMTLELPVRLQVLIPAVDNAISGDAYRPGDVIDTRAFKTVEVDNTDAEGRIVLCDALTFAEESSPDIIIDFATLTGAARVAVGTEIPALFCNSNKLSNDIQGACENSGELVWPLPLHQGYRYQLNSSIADIANASSEGYGGAITAALYLNEFVDSETDWAHIDVMALNTRQRPGRPKGGEAMGLLVIYKFLQQRYQNTIAISKETVH